MISCPSPLLLLHASAHKLVFDFGFVGSGDGVQTALSILSSLKALAILFTVHFAPFPLL